MGIILSVCRVGDASAPALASLYSRRAFVKIAVGVFAIGGAFALLSVGDAFYSNCKYWKSIRLLCVGLEALSAAVCTLGGFAFLQVLLLLLLLLALVLPLLELLLTPLVFLRSARGSRAPPSAAAWSRRRPTPGGTAESGWRAWLLR